MRSELASTLQDEAPCRALPALLAVALLGGFGPACGGEERAIYGADPFARDPAPATPFAGKILTSNAGDDSLSVLDPVAPGPAGRIPVGFNPVELEGPHHLAVDPAGRYVYVNLSLAVGEPGSGPHGVHGAGDQPGFVLKLDARTGRELDRVTVDANPGDSTLSADGRKLYVTHYDAIKWRRGAGASNLVVVDTEQMIVRERRPLCAAAHGVRLSSNDDFLYATCGPDHMAVVNLREPTVPVTLVPVPGGGPASSPSCQRCPYAIGVAPDGTVWLSNLGPGGGGVGRGSVEVFDPQRDGGSFDPVRRIPLRGRPVFASFVADATMAGGYRVIVPEQAGPGDSLRIYTPGAPGQAPAAMGDITLDPQQCLNAHMMAIDAAGDRGHLICEGDQRGPGSFLWLDLASNTVRGAVPIGVFPDGLALVPSLATP